VKVIFRADAGTEMGTGHVMRCLALAQAWQDAGGHVIFAMAMQAPALESRLYAEGMECLLLSTQRGSAADARQTVALAQREDAAAVVVDGYHFDAPYQRAIKEAGLRLLFIDDYGHADRYWADLVLNQNIYAHARLYANRAPYTELLLGARYVLLRREFLAWGTWRRPIPGMASKVLVTLGGGDPDNVTLQVIQALQETSLEELEAVVVSGGSNPHYEMLMSAVRDSPVSIDLKRNVRDMPQLMAWADIAIAAGGSTCWEIAFMGLPALILVLAENQYPVAEGLDAAEMAKNLGWHTEISAMEIAEALSCMLLDEKRRARMARRGREVIDGWGSRRVVGEMMFSTELTLQPVTEADRELLWEWANDPIVRASAFQSAAIPWETHVRWFADKLTDQKCFHYIAYFEEVPVGQIRFDLNDDNEAEIDVSVCAERRGQGMGSRLIELGIQLLRRETVVSRVHALVKQDNTASLRAFKKSGFKNNGPCNVKGHNALHLTRVVNGQE
jgi:UDP-2,4-diacetamido-2,4,6-trideoxy-beta-L-altropyranose hydrolase